MALVPRDSGASVDATSARYSDQIAGDLIAGEDIDAVAPCRIAADGMAYMSDATAADANANIDGFSPVDYKQGEAMTLYGKGTRFGYSAGGLTPGATLYIGATKGRLDDAPTVGDAVGVAKAINTKDIRIVRDA